MTQRVISQPDPPLKTKRLTGTTGGAQGDVTQIAHGLDATKIMFVLATVHPASNAGVTPSTLIDAGKFFYVDYGDTYVRIKLAANPDSANILSKAIDVLVFYR